MFNYDQFWTIKYSTNYSWRIKNHDIPWYYTTFLMFLLESLRYQFLPPWKKSDNGYDKRVI